MYSDLSVSPSVLGPMIAVPSTLSTVVLLFVLAACGADRPDALGALEERSAPTGSLAADVRACELVDLATAQSVIGPETEHPGGDTERETCLYSNRGAAMLTVQIGTAQLYDQMSIPPPHTPVDIGDRGRFSMQPSGPIAVEFVKGDYTVTIGVRPLGLPVEPYEEPLMAAARRAADGLP